MSKHRISKITPVTLYDQDFDIIDKVSKAVGINRSAAVRVIVRYFGKMTKEKFPTAEELIMLGNMRVEV